MRVAFLYGKFSLGPRPLDFDRLYEDRRGLTGSELSCVEYALEMSRRGHEVTLVVGQPMLPREWSPRGQRGITVCQLDNPRVCDGFDAVLSWNEPDLLREISPGPLRIMNQQLNDFGYCIPGWEDYVDVVTSPSAHHLEFLKKQAPNVKRWEVLPNGCDPDLYREDRKVRGRVVWASSADRGLHRLLEAWPAIKRAVSFASLRCFYNFQPAPFDHLEATGPNVHPDLLEIAQRKRYIRHAMSKLQGKHWGVEHIGSVSRNRMRLEFEEAVVLGYPCDTIRYTEGFSVTTMEACASSTLPVVTDVDSLGHIYGSSVPYVPLGAETWGVKQKGEFIQTVTRALTDEAWRADWVLQSRKLAKEHSWSLLAAKLEGIIERGAAARGAAPKKKTKGAKLALAAG